MQAYVDSRDIEGTDLGFFSEVTSSNDCDAVDMGEQTLHEGYDHIDVESANSLPADLTSEAVTSSTCSSLVELDALWPPCAKASDMTEIAEAKPLLNNSQAHPLRTALRHTVTEGNQALLASSMEPFDYDYLETIFNQSRKRRKLDTMDSSDPNFDFNGNSLFQNDYLNVEPAPLALGNFFWPWDWSAKDALDPFEVSYAGSRQSWTP